MQFITEQMLAAAIDGQAPTFDSHDIERYLYFNAQQAFVMELHANVHARYPFTETCRQLGLALLRMDTRIRKVREVTSRTFSDENRPCAEWIKI